MGRCGVGLLITRSQFRMHGEHRHDFVSISDLGCRAANVPSPTAAACLPVLVSCCLHGHALGWLTSRSDPQSQGPCHSVTGAEPAAARGSITSFSTLVSTEQLPGLAQARNRVRHVVYRRPSWTEQGRYVG